MTKLTKTSALAAALAVGTLLVVGVAVAQDVYLDGKVRTGDEVIVPSSEAFSGNLYAFAGRVEIAGSVDGDVVAIGGQVVISGSVAGDVLASAGSVDISGQVGGDVRVGSGNVTVSGDVGGDVLTAAGRGSITSSATVGQDVIFVAGRMTIDGSVDGSVLGNAGSYSSAGTITGTQEVTVSERPQPSASDRLLESISGFVSVLAIGALVLWLIPKAVDRPVQRARERALASLGTGLLGLLALVVLFIGTILGGILLTILLGLLQLGLLVGTLWFALVVAWVVAAFAIFALVVYGAPITAGTLVGRLVLRDGAEPSWARRLGTLALGLVAVVLVTAIPFFGGIVGFLLFLYVLGASVLAVWNVGARAPEAPTSDEGTPIDPGD